jgi:hypothetical protein
MSAQNMKAFRNRTIILKDKITVMISPLSRSLYLSPSGSGIICAVFRFADIVNVEFRKAGTEVWVVSLSFKILLSKGHLLNPPDYGV